LTDAATSLGDFGTFWPAGTSGLTDAASTLTSSVTTI
jgi:hypothetical protein